MVDRAYWAANATFGINKFLWSKLQSELGWNKSNYGGMIPITTPQDQKYFQNYDAPYVVYNFKSTSATKDNYLLRGDQIAYAIYSKNESDVMSSINLITYLLDRMDDSAADINNWMYQQVKAGTTDTTLTRIQAKIDFKTTMVLDSDSSQPETTDEGGRIDGYIVLQTKYTDSTFNVGA